MNSLEIAQYHDTDFPVMDANNEGGKKYKVNMWPSCVIRPFALTETYKAWTDELSRMITETLHDMAGSDKLRVAEINHRDVDKYEHFAVSKLNKALVAMADAHKWQAVPTAYLHGNRRDVMFTFAVPMYLDSGKVKYCNVYCWIELFWLVGLIAKHFERINERY